MDLPNLEIEDIKPNMKVRLQWPDVWVYYINGIREGKIQVRTTREFDHPHYAEKLVDISEIRIIN